MSKKTGVLLKIVVRPVQDTGVGEPFPSQAPHYRVKLDSQRFPYVIIDNEKVILTSKTFPAVCRGRYGHEQYEIELLEGAEEWATIISNPELTTDKLTAIEIGHLAA